MALRFTVLFNKVIFALSGSFVLVEGMTSVFHSGFQETMDTQTIFFLTCLLWQVLQSKLQSHSSPVIVPK